MVHIRISDCLQVNRLSMSMFVLYICYDTLINLFAGYINQLLIG